MLQGQEEVAVREVGSGPDGRLSDHILCLLKLFNEEEPAGGRRRGQTYGRTTEEKYLQLQTLFTGPLNKTSAIHPSIHPPHPPRSLWFLRL